MNPIFLTNLDEKEFKEFLKGAIREVLGEKHPDVNTLQPPTEILNIQQVCDFLHLHISTI